MRQLKVVVSSWVLGSLLLAAPAFADIPPADACMMADEGQACDNAGDNADQPGVCQKDSCTKQTPDGEMTYECYLCQAAESGGGGQGNTGDGGATSQGGTTSKGGSSMNTAGTTTAGDSSDSEDDGDGGCSVSPVPAAGLAGLLAPLVAFGLAAARRRRSPR